MGETDVVMLVSVMMVMYMGHHTLFTCREIFIYMWGALSFLADNVWESVDDIWVGVLVLTVGHMIAHGVHYLLGRLLKYPMFIVDIITTSWRFFLFAVCLYQIIGVGAVQHFVAGFSVGIGYALQPYIISMFNGAAMFGSGMVERGALVKFKADDTDWMTVIHVGLFFTRLEYGRDTVVFVSNSEMIQNTLYVQKRKL